MKKTLFFLFLLIMPLAVSAQVMEIGGTVTDAAMNAPLPGVAVMVKGTSDGTVTDMDGKYSISAKKGDILVFNALSMKTVEVEVTSSSTIDVVMEDDLEVLEEVVVIGYGTVKKSHLSGSVSSVDAKALDANVSTNAATALQGKIAGVFVSASSGNPNEDMTINIRGVSSLSNNSPLFVIDGAFGDMSMVDPNDIASIEVLKDAAAAAIYGSRAAGGVVLITTRSGRKDTPTKVDVNFFTGVQHNPKRIDVMSGEQYSQFAQQYGLAADGYGANQGETFIGKGTDWQKEGFKPAMMYKANATITGGSKTATYSASASYLNRDGIMLSTSHESYNIRVKSDFSLFDNRVRIGESIIVRMAKGIGGTDQESTNWLLRFPPVVPVYKEDGGWGTSSDINLPNPVGYADIMDISSKRTNIFLNAYAQVEIIKGLIYKLNFGYRRNHSEHRTYTNSYDLGYYGTNPAPDLSESFGSYESWLLENTLNYDRTFGRHTVSALLGYSAQKDSNYSLSGSNKDLPEFIETMTGNVNTMTATSSRSELALASIFARVMYSYDDRYLFSASLRRDGSSRFHKGYQYGNFPSASVGWNIHNEKFFGKARNSVDELKLRFSYGRLGNQDVGGYYPTLSVVSDNMNYVQGGNTWFGQMPYVSAVSPENLTWENTETFNLGLDMTFLRDRLTVTADAYIKNTNDVLIPIPSASSTGIGGSSIQNAGQVQNKGVELAVNWRSSAGKFNYYVGANFSYEKNLVRNITAGGNGMYISGYNAHNAGGRGITMFQVGHSMSYFNLIETDGLFQSQDEIDSYVGKDGEPIQPAAKPGDIKYKDYNGDGRINTDDQHDVGSPFPDFTFGLRLGGDWNGLDFSLFFDGIAGNKIFNYTRYCLESGAFAGNMTTALLNSWTTDNTDTDMPRFSKVDGADNKLAYTDRWLENGSYFRLKTVDIGYTFPQHWMDKARIRHLRVFVTIENLFTLTKYSGYTPDLGETSSTGASYNIFSRGIDHGRYPIPRTFSAGIQIGL